MNAGLTFHEAGAVKSMYNSINSYDANDTTMNDHDYFNKWLNDQNFTDSEISKINENYKFYSMVPQEESGVLTRLTENGMSYDEAYKVAESISRLQPEDGEDEVSTAQKYDAVVNNSSLSTEEKQQAISAIAGKYSLVSKLSADTVQTMMDLYQSTGQTAVLSAEGGTGYEIDSVDYDYTEEQQEAYNEAYVNMLNNIGGETVSSIKTMKNLKKIAANAGKYAAFSASGESVDLSSTDYSLYRNARAALNTGLSLVQYEAIKEAGNSFTADKDSSGKSIRGSIKKKVVAYLKGQGLTTSQYNFFYYTVFGYKS